MPDTFAPAPMDVETVTSPAWLGAALSQGRTPIEVAGVEVVETLGPSALKIRMKLDFAGPQPADVPDTVCLKGVFNPALTDYLKSGAQVAEASFYKECAAELSVRVPRALYAGIDPDTFAGVILMQDEIPRGTRFLTALSPYTPEQARESLDQLARLHGGGWGADTGRRPWLVSKLGYLSNFQGVPGPRLTELLTGERGEKLPEEVRSGERIYAALRALTTRGERLPSTFVHGDAHAGNVFEAHEGIGLIDWQLLQLGDWSLDVAYHIAAVLEVEDRRRSEQDLLRHYLDRLGVHGGEPPPWEDAWRRYRESTIYGYFLWAITLRVQPEIIHTFVTRLGTAAADHDGFGLLGV